MRYEKNNATKTTNKSSMDLEKRVHLKIKQTLGSFRILFFAWILIFRLKPISLRSSFTGGCCLREYKWDIFFR